MRWLCRYESPTIGTQRRTTAIDNLLFFYPQKQIAYNFTAHSSVQISYLILCIERPIDRCTGQDTMFGTDQPYLLTHTKLKIKNVSNELKPFSQIIQSSIMLMEVCKKKKKTCYDQQVRTHEGFLTYLEATIGY